MYINYDSINHYNNGCSNYCLHGSQIKKADLQICPEVSNGIACEIRMEWMEEAGMEMKSLTHTVMLLGTAEPGEYINIHSPMSDSGALVTV